MLAEPFDFLSASSRRRNPRERALEHGALSTVAGEVALEPLLQLFLIGHRRRTSLHACDLAETPSNALWFRRVNKRNLVP
jgi:hypothetical protein